MKHFAVFSSGLANLFHMAIAGEAPSSVKHHQLKKAYGVKTSRAGMLQVELDAAKPKIARQAKQIKSLELSRASDSARHQKQVDALRADLELLAQEAAVKETSARQETRESFQNSPSGARFLNVLWKELLVIYHESMPFLTKLCPAAKK